MDTFELCSRRRKRGLRASVKPGARVKAPTMDDDDDDDDEDEDDGFEDDSGVQLSRSTETTAATSGKATAHAFGRTASTQQLMSLEERLRGRATIDPFGTWTGGDPALAQ